MKQHFEEHGDRLRRDAGLMDFGLMNKLLVAACILIMTFWLLSPVREIIGGWLGHKPREQLVVENTKQAQTIDTLLQVNKSNERTQEVKKDIEEIVDKAMVQEKEVQKVVTKKTTDRVKVMAERIEKLKTSPPDPEVNVGERISEEIINTLWDNHVTLTQGS